jgi:hypothetical protein
LLLYEPTHLPIGFILCFSEDSHARLLRIGFGLQDVSLRFTRFSKNAHDSRIDVSVLVLILAYDYMNLPSHDPPLLQPRDSAENANRNDTVVCGQAAIPRAGIRSQSLPVELCEVRLTIASPS